MELWMRSQDRTDLICTNRIYAVNNQIRTNVYGVIGFIVLGEYKTKERALEVLDEIQKIFMFNTKCYSYQEADLFLKTKMLPMFYEMPEK